MTKCEKGGTGMTSISRILCETTDSGTFGNVFQELMAWNNAVSGSPGSLASWNSTLKPRDV